MYSRGKPRQEDKRGYFTLQFPNIIVYSRYSILAHQEWEEDSMYEEQTFHSVMGCIV